MTWHREKFNIRIFQEHVSVSWNIKKRMQNPLCGSRELSLSYRWWNMSCERDETIEHTKWTRNTIIIWIFEHDEGTWIFLNRYFHCEKMFSLNFCINWFNRNDRNFQLQLTEAVNMELSKQFRSINKPMNFEWPNSAFLMGFSRIFVCPESLE